MGVTERTKYKNEIGFVNIFQHKHAPSFLKVNLNYHPGRQARD